MKRSRIAGCIIFASAGAAARADLVRVNQFNTPPAVGLGSDHGIGGAWVYSALGPTINNYEASGILLGSLPRPGEPANHADIQVTVAALTLAGVPLASSSILFFNGESGVAEVYALNRSTGAVLATLVTGFGDGHVVGGAHHHQRGTIFLLQNAAAAGTPNLVAEIDSTTGAVLQSWQTTTSAPGFTIDRGDLDVAPNGNILIASSDQASLAEFTPTGALVALYALPNGVSSLAGIALNHNACYFWGVETNGQVARMMWVPARADCRGCYPNCDASTNTPILHAGDFICFNNMYAGGNLAYANCDGSTAPPILNANDFICFLNKYAAGCP